MSSRESLEGREVDAGALQDLVHEAAIRRVHLDYCRGVDRRDWELVRSCYHPGAVDHHGPFSGGIDAFIEWAQEFVVTVAATTHFVGNQIVDLDGDRAQHEAYCRAYHRLKPTDRMPAVDYVVNLRYLDRMEVRGGRWAIADRLVVHDTERWDLVPDLDGETSAYFPGGFAPDDASYERVRPWAEFIADRRSRL